MNAIPLPRIKPILDEEIIQCLSEIDFKDLFLNRETWMGNPRTTEEFIETHTSWIKNSTANEIIGLDDFKIRTITHGTSDAIADYHWAFKDYRLRVFEKEYAFHNMSVSNYTLVHEDDLRTGDALIISLPFSGFGCEHPEYRDVMEICTKKNIPVLVDCCYFGICQNVEFKLDYPCIEAVCFSVSKTFASGHFRVGTLFSKNPAPSHIDALSTWGHTPQLNAKISTILMNKFNSDFIPNKYRSTQLEICKEYDIEATNSMVMGIGDYPYESDWPEKVARFDYNDETFWRWGLRDLIKERYNINNPKSS